MPPSWDLKLHIRPCPRQTLLLEGAFDVHSRFRPEAMEYVQKYYGSSTNLTFPLLVDQTEWDSSGPTVILQSYDILQHLWKKYGQSVSTKVPRPDQRWNSNNIPFVLRFLSLAGPSYVRPWPKCGLLRTPSLWPSSQDDGQREELVLYQSEGCPESRLVRETLCTLEIPYLSIPIGLGSSHSLPNPSRNIPVLVDGDCILEGARDCQEHLWKNYKDPHGRQPHWWDLPPTHNLGRAGSFSVGAYTAWVRGTRAFVPDRVFE